jgi:hypothetical protein
MTPAEFARKWGESTQKERSAAQEHFIDLCRMLGVPTPNEADPTGTWYAFERGAGKTGGGDGFADVWKRSHFAWEYKGKRRDLNLAYEQLLRYRDNLENPPVLVVCDIDRFEVRTNFTNTPTRLYAFSLADLARDPAEPMRILRALMTDPEELRPREAAAELTSAAAGRFADLAIALRARGEAPERVARFLDRLLFCMYAEDAGVLPKGLLSRLAEATSHDPDEFAGQLRSLFGHMAGKGGFFGVERVDWFNGGLFADADALVLTRDEVKTLIAAGKLDWSLIEPAIFGTLFERGLDPAQRSALGAHFTSRSDIERLVEPVVMAPLRREAMAARAEAARLLELGTPAGRAKAMAVHEAFLARLRGVRVLDPACGSGNFLYIALRKLKDLEYDQTGWASVTFGIPMAFPQVGPEAVLGIEVNPYAAELARIAIWIGEIQWHLAHGFAYRRDPVLRPLDGIECRDALLDLSDPANPREAEWPPAEFIVGNPPFLGDKLMVGGLGERYVEALRDIFRDRLPGASDLCCYWREKGRAAIDAGRTRRCGLLATQGIRGGANRRVLDRIRETGDIFLGVSDERWVLAGAVVHISFVGQDDGTERSRTLDGVPVIAINANLTAGVDVTQSRRLVENADIAWIGTQKGGPFDLTATEASLLLAAPNPDGRPNADVVRPWMNGLDLTRRPRNLWIIDYGTDMSKGDAALYEAPFEIVRERVAPLRQGLRRAHHAERWWIHEESRPGMRRALAGLPRYIGTPRVAKHRVFVWIDAAVLPDSQIVAFARDDDFTFGVLQSKAQEEWARATGTQLREAESGFRYTPSSCFEPFPFPEPTDPQRDAIAAAAKRLVELRDGWLAADAARTLTGLYNARPTWLDMAHANLDAAVLDAYGLPRDAGRDQILAHLLALNLERAGATGAGGNEDATPDDLVRAVFG